MSNDEISREVRDYARILAKRWGVEAEPLVQQGLRDVRAGDSVPDALQAMARAAMREREGNPPPRRSR